MSRQRNESKGDDKKVFAIVAVVLCFIIIVVALMYFRMPSQYQTYSQNEIQNHQPPTQDEQKTRREFIVEVTSSNGHRVGITVEDENGEEFYSVDFESDDNATKEYKIKAGVGDRVIVEVLCPWETNHASVKLVKEGALFRYSLAHEFDFDRVVLIYTIKEDDM